MAVVVNGFDYLIAVKQFLNWYSHELFGVAIILYNVQLTKAKCL